MAFPVTNGTHDAEIFGIARVGQDIYTAGYKRTATDDLSGKIWKNGVPTLQVSNGEASALVVIPSLHRIWA